ncbi:MAG: hypothetical protein LBD23_06920 [Oscillospiraceae bacterium]|jgi:D-alanyl-D-alanine carboxypeptidase (penicillin-binding protein 5/6)|nr:hypothetical protein [Oscillospiraceae bacterium]
MVKKTAFFLLMIFIIQVFSSISVTASESFRDLAAKSAILIERDTGIVLFEHNSHIRHPADSLAKVMTLLLASYAVENDEISDNELIVMTESAWEGLDDNDSTMGIVPGEEMTFIDLMYSAYVGNASEACNMLALRIAGSIDAFVGLMNEKAAEFAADNTNFANAHGRFRDSQYTTAYDQFIIFNEAMKSSLFTEVASTFRHITEGSDIIEPRTITGSNSLINQNSKHFFRYCIAGRDSATFEGGYSLVALSVDEGLSLISVILGSDVVIFDDESTDIRSFSETVRLLNWGYTQFSWRDVLKTTDLLEKVPIMHGSGADFVNARPESSLSLLLDNSVPNDAFIREITIFYDEEDNPLIAPVAAGTVLGEVVISRDGVEYAKIALVANTDISLDGFEYMRRQVVAMLSTRIARNVIIVLVALVLLYIALVIRYNIVRANRLRRIRNAKEEIIRERHQNYRD